MDFKDYTNILASMGIITWKQCAQICDAMDRIEDARHTRQQKIEDDFFDQEFGPGT